jgi:hypothetical protein
MQKPAYNSLKTGFILGIFIPLASFLGFYLVRYRSIPFSEFITYVYLRDVLSSLISLNILPNLILFFIFIRMNYLLSAKGVLIATFLFAGIVFIVKFST